ncbi:hypothetical protein [Bradyrhizobium elkanii]|uniref:hypothetical protein n=1 Tax=Bradyrhizobium elkanii TaxID=29448 RepID=UPI0008420FF5|nr:hypothetical protein [Bradyrhizobium elkanii]ODM71716.1 hypothetical protein A6X20_07175 [Bradyrhizobium elkanii]ODM79089.1 hypothetical protein A6452_28760 [Bradyrhizobium elkanii]
MKDMRFEFSPLVKLLVTSSDPSQIGDGSSSRRLLPVRLEPAASMSKTTIADVDAIARLRAEYAALHREVIERFAKGESDRSGALQRLQIREQEIVSELRKFGAGPYEKDGEQLLREARAH